MKIVKLKENYLDDLHRYNKKRQKGMSPFCYLNPNAGDVPKAIGRFNNSVDSNASVGMSEDYDKVLDKAYTVRGVISDPEIGSFTILKQRGYNAIVKFKDTYATLHNIEVKCQYGNSELYNVESKIKILYGSIIWDAHIDKKYDGGFINNLTKNYFSKCLYRQSISYKKAYLGGSQSTFIDGASLGYFYDGLDSISFDILDKNAVLAIENFVKGHSFENFKLDEKVLSEESYGGSYDIEGDQFFTREEINEFVFNICDGLTEHFGYQYEPYEAYMIMPQKILYIRLQDNNGFEEESLMPIDMRKIRSGRNPLDKYKDEILNEFKRKFERDYQDANLDESLDISGYSFISTLNDGGKIYNLYKKIADGKAKWLAVKTNNGNEVGEPFEITYEQARGFEPINSIGKLQRKLGKVLLPKREFVIKNRRGTGELKEETVRDMLSREFKDYKAPKWLAPKGLSDSEYMALIKERRPSYKFDNINNGGNKSQRLFRELDRIIRQDNERELRKRLTALNLKDDEPNVFINDLKYNFEDDDMPDFYKVESCRGNKMKFKKLKESYFDTDKGYVYLEYPNLYVEFSYTPSEYIGAHSDTEDTDALFGTSYKDTIEYEYRVPIEDVKEIIQDYIFDDKLNGEIPDRDYIMTIIDNLDTSNYSNDGDPRRELGRYIDDHLQSLLDIFNDRLLDEYKDAAVEEASKEIRKEL